MCALKFLKVEITQIPRIPSFLQLKTVLTVLLALKVSKMSLNIPLSSLSMSDYRNVLLSLMRAAYVVRLATLIIRIIILMSALCRGNYCYTDLHTLDIFEILHCFTETHFFS